MRRPKSRAHPDAVAVTCGGDVLVNAGCFDDMTSLEEMLKAARKEKGEVFIGFVVARDELPLAFDRVHDACREGAAFLVGRRLKRRRAR